MDNSSPFAPGKTGDKPSVNAKAAHLTTQTFYTADSASLHQDNNVGLLIKQVQASLNRMIDGYVSPLGLTAMQWRPLAVIRYRHIDTAAELSRHIQVDMGAMTRTLDRLEVKEFIIRHRCEEDRRVVRIKLTEAGIDVAQQILPAVSATLNTHLQGFDKAEIETLIDMLQRMLINGEK